MLKIQILMGPPKIYYNAKLEACRCYIFKNFHQNLQKLAKYVTFSNSKSRQNLMVQSKTLKLTVVMLNTFLDVLVKFQSYSYNTFKNFH